MKKLKGLCVNCLGCNRLENENFEGVYRCPYNDNTITPEQIKEENKDK